MGELNLDANDQKLKKEASVSSLTADRPYPDCPYLLLDVREREQYDQCHIISGMWPQFEVELSERLKPPEHSPSLCCSTQFPHRVAVPNDEPLHQRSAGICILNIHLSAQFFFIQQNHFQRVLAAQLVLTHKLQKNATGKIIIVYDEDERLASQAATTMCQRGFENLFMLSGGKLSQLMTSHQLEEGHKKATELSK